MKKFLTFFLLFISSFSFAINKLSPSAEISLLTAEKGSELYSAYGHSSIRIKDEISNLDIIFNYGTFEVDDNELLFLAKFVKGILDYTLSTEPYDWYINSYSGNNRGVTEQILDITLTEKQAIFNRLIVNYESDERYYRYDFFFDNCSSRIHEILKEVLGETLIYGDDILGNSPETFRDLIDPAFDFSPWAEFGVGIIMGFPTDDTATNKQKMFLPLHMMERFDIATYNGKPFVKTTKNLFKSTKKDISTPFYTNPLFVFSLLFVIVALISFINFKKNKHFYYIDYSLFFITGLIGVFFLFMWFGTRHSPAFENMNMFWAMPLNIIVMFFIKSPKTRHYLMFMALLNVIGFIVLPQVFHWAVIPISLMMALRYFKLYFFMKKTTDI